MSRPIRARIDLDALRRNIAVARRFAGNSRIWAVIKANAYGHGFRRVANALEPLADGFALLDIEDAATLRDSGCGKPILLIEGCFEPRDLDLAARLGMTPAIHSDDALRMLELSRLPAPIDVYLKVNTGMSRLGFPLADLQRVRERVAAIEAVRDVTLMTHFADADGERGVDWQLDRLVASGWAGSVSLANSAALLRHPAAVRGWVRPGIMLYGATPFADASAADLGLSPVMTLESRIIGVQRLEAGERIGYGGLFEADGPMRVGIVACGYADGYPRHAPGDNRRQTPILVGGRRTRTLGRVSMDMLACDLTDLPEAEVGSPVVLWGDGLPVDEVAAAAGTIGYELLCAVAPRVPMVEVDDGQGQDRL